MYYVEWSSHLFRDAGNLEYSLWSLKSDSFILGKYTYLTYYLRVGNIGDLKWNLHGTAGKLMLIQSTVTLQWLGFFSCFGFSGYIHQVFVCTACAAEVCPRQEQQIHAAPFVPPSAQSPWVGHEAGDYFLLIFVLSFVWGLVREVLLVDGLFYRVAWASCQFWFFCKCSIVGGYVQNGALLCFHLSKPFQAGLKSQGWYSPCLCMPIRSGMKHVERATVCLCSTK